MNYGKPPNIYRLLTKKSETYNGNIYKLYENTTITNITKYTKFTKYEL